MYREVIVAPEIVLRRQKNKTCATKWNVLFYLSDHLWYPFIRAKKKRALMVGKEEGSEENREKSLEIATSQFGLID